jgi:cyclopropane-fatty-acyl-phospholipid synthase
MAEHYPDAAITAVSNSRSQREHIEREAARRGIGNVTVLTADMNDFDTDRRFDRVVSLEMFEHMRNYRRLFARVAGWLVPGGKFFMHIFCHRNSPYEFVDRGPSDWMSRHFFSGGIMPSDDLPLHFQEDLTLLRRWRWNGQHYEKTLNAWLARMDGEREALMPILRETYGATSADTWWVRWRLFFMACAELFGYRDGGEWWVGHYLFERPDA